MAIKFDKSKLVKNLAQGNILAPFLDKEFETFDEAFTFDYTEKVEDNAWHPSGDCTPKVTELYAKAKGKERQPISGSLRKSFMVGHYWHQVLQYIILNKLKFCTPESVERRGIEWWGNLTPALHDPVSRVPHNYLPMADEPINHFGIPLPYHWVTGAGDIAPLETPKWRGIVDIKTMSSYQFKQSSLPEWATAKYLCQINLYMYLFDEERGLILAVNKDAPHDFKEFHYTRDDQLITAILDKWRFVAACLADDSEPTDEDNEVFVLPIK